MHNNSNSGGGIPHQYSINSSSMESAAKQKIDPNRASVSSPINNHLSPQQKRSKHDMGEEKFYEDGSYNPQATFNPANNSMVFNPLNNSSLIGNNNSFNNSHLGSPSFVGPSSTNNSFIANQSNPNFNMSNTYMNFQQNIPENTHNMGGEQTDSSTDSKNKISAHLSQSKPTLNPNLTPAQKFSITAKRKWTSK